MKTLRAYSYYPYHRPDARDVYQRAVKYFFAFKNGRDYRSSDRRKSQTFDQIVQKLSEKAGRCPVFRHEWTAVPVPRSGSSQKPFSANACEYPCWALAQRLAKDGHVVEARQILHRHKPVSRASDTEGRIPIETHLDSLTVTLHPSLKGAPLILIDDLITRGTQLMACYLALRRAGHEGSVEAFCVSQTVARDPTDEQLEPYLEHLISWRDGWSHANRTDHGQWDARSWRNTNRSPTDH